MGWTVAGILRIVLIGFLLIPVMLVATVMPLVHTGYAAYQVSKGFDSLALPGRKDRQEP